MIFHPSRGRVVSELYYKNRQNVRLFGIKHDFFNQAEGALYLNCIIKVELIFAFLE